MEPSLDDYTLEISLQSQRGCTASSECSLQSSHPAEEVICLRCRFAIVGKASLQALHTKCLILFGTRSCQRHFQNFFWFSRLELPALGIESQYTIILYALLVANIPEEV